MDHSNDAELSVRLGTRSFVTFEIRPGSVWLDLSSDVMFQCVPLPTAELATVLTAVSALLQPTSTRPEPNPLWRLMAWVRRSEAAPVASNVIKLPSGLVVDLRLYAEPGSRVCISLRNARPPVVALITLNLPMPLAETFVDTAWEAQVASDDALTLERRGLPETQAAIKVHLASFQTNADRDNN